jgi:hypothetical protein
MRRLIPHPDFAAPTVRTLDANAILTGASLALTYVLDADLAALVIPPPAAPVRTDELWKHTCFEAFLRGDGEGYLELNFAPSGAWAAYRFDGYRDGQANAEIAAPTVAVERDANTLTLRAKITLPASFASPRRIALTAVIEHAAGQRSYWSLNHPDGRPDFHAAANFAPFP